MPRTISAEDPRTGDVTELLGRHQAFAHENTAPGLVYALDIDGLLDPAVSLFGLRDDGRLVGIGALKELDPTHAEVKSMHTLAAARGTGVAGAVLDHIVATARSRGFAALSLETGAAPVFAPAWAVYERRGFVPCGAFADYADVPTSRFMTLALG